MYSCTMGSAVVLVHSLLAREMVVHPARCASLMISSHAVTQAAATAAKSTALLSPSATQAAVESSAAILCLSNTNTNEIILCEKFFNTSSGSLCTINRKKLIYILIDLTIKDHFLQYSDKNFSHFTFYDCVRSRTYLWWMDWMMRVGMRSTQCLRLISSSAYTLVEVT